MSKSPQRPWITEKKQNDPDTPANDVTGRKHNTKKKSGLNKSLASLSRWLHIYLSMISFAILLFFAVTGLTLNHPDWFADQQTTASIKGQLRAEWVNVTDTSKIAKLEIVEYFRTKESIKGAVSEFRIGDDECSVSFKGPGYAADAYVDRETGKYELSVIRSGVVAVMNDLHKGRDSGSKWAWVIDVSAILMTLVSLSGIILICFIKRKRTNGLLIAFIGAILCYVIYKVFVP